MSDTPEKKPLQAVLIGVTFDDLHPMSDEIGLRYNSGSQTYTQKFIAASCAVYGSMEDLVQINYDGRGKTFLQYVELDDSTAPNGQARHLLLLQSNKRDMILYDDLDRLEKFKQSFGLWNQSVIVLSETQPRQVEQLKA